MTGCSYDRMEANIVLGYVGNQEERVVPKAIQTVQQKKISRNQAGNVKKHLLLWQYQ